MADSILTDLGTIPSVAAGDLEYIVDVSDLTDDAAGSSKKVAVSVKLAKYDNQVATLTNKTIDADGAGNSITNIEDANIKAGAAIDASKIADGSVSDAEFQRLDGLTADIQGQIDLKADITSETLVTPTTDDLTFTGRCKLDKGADVASPAGGIMTLGADGNSFDITGTNTINEILGTDWAAGNIIHLHFDGILTVSDDSGGTNDILLGDSTDMTTAAGDILTLQFDGTDWREVSRSVVGSSSGSQFTMEGQQADQVLDETKEYGGFGSNVALGGTESFRGTIVTKAFTAKQFTVQVLAHSGQAGDVVAALAIDGVDSAMTVNITVNTTGEFTASTDVSVAAGDRLSISLDNTAVGNTGTCTIGSFQLLGEFA